MAFSPGIDANSGVLGVSLYAAEDAAGCELGIPKMLPWVSLIWCSKQGLNAVGGSSIDFWKFDRTTRCHQV